MNQKLSRDNFCSWYEFFKDLIRDLKSKISISFRGFLLKARISLAFRGDFEIITAYKLALPP